jgi:hypothetical protein
VRLNVHENVLVPEGLELALASDDCEADGVMLIKEEAEEENGADEVIWADDDKVKVAVSETTPLAQAVEDGVKHGEADEVSEPEVVVVGVIGLLAVVELLNVGEMLPITELVDVALVE